ncbi:MAG: hypothetical protein J2P17_29910 [Mycobacterium sp.]|nr:hypothetical protein [Mycobacterium sp.]
MAYLAFWATKLQLDVFYFSIWQVARYPADIFTRPIRLILTYIFPMALNTILNAATRNPMGRDHRLRSGSGMSCTGRQRSLADRTQTLYRRDVVIPAESDTARNLWYLRTTQ